MESGCRFRNDRHSLAGSGALNLNTVDRQDEGSMAGAVDLQIALNGKSDYKVVYKDGVGDGVGVGVGATPATGR